jgi:hypothetical protein
MTTRRVSKIVTAHRTNEGDAWWTSHSTAWVADEAGDYIEVNHGGPNQIRTYHHVLDYKGA